MKKLIQFWDSTFYTDLLFTIALIIVFFISCIKRKKHPQFKLLPFYFGTFIIIRIFYYIGVLDLYPKLTLWLNDYIDGFVTLIEFCSFMYFFFFAIRNIKKRKFVKKITLAILIISSLIILRDAAQYQILRYSSLTNIYIIETFSLLIPCFIYYHELFTSIPKLNLLQEANFWTTTGLTFYLICTLPITFVLVYFFKTDYQIYLNVYTVIHLFYIFLFLMIIKSYLCKETN